MSEADREHELSQSIELAQIKTDGGTQSRHSINKNVVAEYAAAMTDGAQFPPIVVFHDGSHYWLADGFHRWHAHKDAGKQSILADVRQGTQRDAILHSVGANNDHGVRRSAKDKRRAVLRLLEDSEWGKWSNREIARRCAVGKSFVNNLRHSLATEASDKSERTYTTKHGTEATMYVNKIGRKINLPPGKKTRAERSEEISKLASEGNRAEQIATILGISSYQVKQIAKEENIKLVDTAIPRQRKIDLLAVIERTVDALSGLAGGLQVIKSASIEIPADIACEWASDMDASFRELNWLRRVIKETKESES